MPRAKTPKQPAPGRRPARRPRLPSLSVKARVALLTAVPLLGLGLVFAIYWSNAAAVRQHLARSQADMRTAIEIKAFRDQIVAAQLGLADFHNEPSQSGRDGVVGSEAAARKALDALLQHKTPEIERMLAPLERGLASLSDDVDGVLKGQTALGFDDASGLAGTLADALDVLEKAAMTDLDYNDPLEAAMSEAYRKLRFSQYKFAASRAVADSDAFSSGADALRKAAEASLLGADKKAEVTAAVDAATKSFAAWATALQDVLIAGESAAGHFRMVTVAADSDVLAASNSAAKAQTGLAEVQDGTVRLVGATIVTIVIACGALGFAIGRSISRPIGRLAGTMRRMAGGDLDAPVETRDGRDEIGAMTAAVLTFKTAAIEKVRLEGEADRARDLAAAEQRQRETEKAAQSARDAHAAEELASGLDRLSDGDLISRLDTELDAKFEKMRADFNGALGKLQQTMLTVRENAQTIHTRTEEIAGAAGHLSQRTEQQAASLEETAASLGEVTASVKKTAQGASEARDVVIAARGDAEAGGEVVKQAITAMSAIERSSKQIGQIIGVIDEIAFQTNLLALNAGVEAARAGDAGRGFAVVASEVRSLAQRSAQAAKEIKALISTSMAQVEGGVTLVSRTGQALDGLVGQIGRITGFVNTIAASASSEAGSLDQVRSAVDHMDKITQQNAAMVEETTAAAQALARETEDLGRLIDRFRTGHASAPVTARAAQAKPAARPVRQMRVVKQAVAAEAAEDWAEF